jgi:predicted AlkP superfamily pyrophosphatase or phosphodiesterase
MGLGGPLGGDLYVNLAPGYDFDPRIGPGPLIAETEPYGNHGADPEEISMHTIMVLNGPGIRPGEKLDNVRIIDFAPTLASLLSLPRPKNATGRILNEALELP